MNIGIILFLTTSQHNDYSWAMDSLKKWYGDHGVVGRRVLYGAIKDRFPGFTQTALSNYFNGKRVPDLEVATIISETTGIPLYKLSFRYTHKPGNGQRFPLPVIPDPPAHPHPELAPETSP